MLKPLPRIREEEWMDRPDLDDRLHRDALLGLARLNRISAVAGPLYRRIRRLARQTAGDLNSITTSPDRPLRVLDVASGGGDVPIDWLKRAAQDQFNLEITTLDISPLALEVQRERAHRAGVHLQPRQADLLCDELPSGFDVVTNSLFLHHLDPPQVTKAIDKMQSCGRHVLICDLVRSRLNLASVWIASRLLTRSPVVHTDATISVRAGWTRAEMAGMIRTATGRDVVVKHLHPARLVACWSTESQS
ncbi:MAG: methyltransferase domain-containing protein [Planctomycetota bacterium]